MESNYFFFRRVRPPTSCVIRRNRRNSIFIHSVACGLCSSGFQLSRVVTDSYIIFRGLHALSFSFDFICYPQQPQQVYTQQGKPVKRPSGTIAGTDIGQVWQLDGNSFKGNKLLRSQSLSVSRALCLVPPFRQRPVTPVVCSAICFKNYLILWEPISANDHLNKEFVFPFRSTRV